MDKLTFGFIFALAGLQVLTAVELEITPTDKQVQGDTVHIKCLIPDAPRFTLNRITRVINGEHHLIAMNNQLKPPFDQDTRYSTVASENAVAHSEVVIEDVQGSDAGKITCTMKGTEDTDQAVDELDIDVPPFSVEIMFNGEPLEDGSTLVLGAQHGNTPYSCVVNVEGDYRPPRHISLVLDSQDIFEQLHKKPLEIIQHNNGYADFKYSGTFEKGPDSPSLYDVQYHNKSLVCTAHTDPFESVTTQVTLQINHGPTTAADCSRTQHYKLGDDMELTCTFTMFPSPQRAEWMFGETMMSSTETSEDGRMETNVEKVDDFDYKYTLTLRDVTETDTLDEYMLTVVNAHDETSITIKLDQVHVETTPAASTSTSAPVTKPVVETGKQKEQGSSAAAHAINLLLVSLMVIISSLL